MTKDSTLRQAAFLEVIAGLFATLAEGLGTVAAALAIQETEQQANTNQEDIQQIHKQLNYIKKCYKPLYFKGL